jgi:hypothetical protein
MSPPYGMNSLLVPFLLKIHTANFYILYCCTFKQITAKYNFCLLFVTLSVDDVTFIIFWFIFKFKVQTVKSKSVRNLTRSIDQLAGLTRPM